MWYFNYKNIDYTIECSIPYRNEYRNLATDRVEVGPFDSEEKTLEATEALKEHFDELKDVMDHYE